MAFVKPKIIYMNSIIWKLILAMFAPQYPLTTLSTPILRQTSCDQRAVWDCILRSQARNLLNTPKQRLPPLDSDSTDVLCLCHSQVTTKVPKNDNRKIQNIPEQR